MTSIGRRSRGESLVEAPQAPVAAPSPSPGPEKRVWQVYRAVMQEVADDLVFVINSPRLNKRQKLLLVVQEVTDLTYLSQASSLAKICSYHPYNQKLRNIFAKIIEDEQIWGGRGAAASEDLEDFIKGLVRKVTGVCQAEKGFLTEEGREFFLSQADNALKKAWKSPDVLPRIEQILEELHVLMTFDNEAVKNSALLSCERKLECHKHLASYCKQSSMLATSWHHAEGAVKQQSALNKWLAYENMNKPLLNELESAAASLPAPYLQRRLDLYHEFSEQTRSAMQSRLHEQMGDLGEKLYGKMNKMLAEGVFVDQEGTLEKQMTLLRDQHQAFRFLGKAEGPFLGNASFQLTETLYEKIVQPAITWALNWQTSLDADDALAFGGLIEEFDFEALKECATTVREKHRLKMLKNRIDAYYEEAQQRVFAYIAEKLTKAYVVVKEHFNHDPVTDEQRLAVATHLTKWGAFLTSSHLCFLISDESDDLILQQGELFLTASVQFLSFYFAYASKASGEDALFPFEKEMLAAVDVMEKVLECHKTLLSNLDDYKKLEEGVAFVRDLQEMRESAAILQALIASQNSSFETFHPEILKAIVLKERVQGTRLCQEHVKYAWQVVEKHQQVCISMLRFYIESAHISLGLERGGDDKLKPSLLLRASLERLEEMCKDVEPVSVEDCTRRIRALTTWKLKFFVLQTPFYQKLLRLDFVQRYQDLSAEIFAQIFDFVMDKIVKFQAEVTQPEQFFLFSLPVMLTRIEAFFQPLEEMMLASDARLGYPVQLRAKKKEIQDACRLLCVQPRHKDTASTTTSTWSNDSQGW